MFGIVLFLNKSIGEDLSGLQPSQGQNILITSHECLEVPFEQSKIQPVNTAMQGACQFQKRSVWHVL